MGVQYFCQNERRRQAIDGHATLNGIDYLEVLDQEAPVGSPPQRTLLVRFVNALSATLSRSNVRIDGGVRVTAIEVEWVGRAADADALFAAGHINNAERIFLLNQPEPDHLLVVRTDSTGDFSAYRLSLVVSPTNPTPPTDFDRILSQIEFSFKVECPTEFDCRVEQECPPEPVTEPEIDYLAKDYASFRKLILDRLAVIMPDWQERNPADLGIALVELLAYAGDYLSYYQDAVATEAYLETARRRTSMRRHARLLDYPMHDGCNARTWVAIAVNPAGDGMLLPMRDPATRTPTRLLTDVPAAGNVIAEDRLMEVIATAQPTVFELMHDLRLYAAHNELSFYTWGDEECCLPKGATQATLIDDVANRRRLRPGDILIFEERRDPGTGLEEDADLAHRHAVRLTAVHPMATEDGSGNRTPGPLVTDELFDQPIVDITWDAEDALPFPLCLSAVVDGTLVEDMSVALGNVVLADHGRTIDGEDLDEPRGHLRYRPRLQEREITHRVRYDHEAAVEQAAGTTILQNPRQALPSVTLTGDGENWMPQRDLLNSDRFATEFVVEMESDGHAYLRFGDGRFGREPAANGTRHATYRIGNGTGGNIGPEALAHIVANVSDIDGVRNPLPAQGGAAVESLTEVRLYAPQAFRIQERAVTEADYAAVAERHPEVQKVMATRRWTGSWYTMFVTIDRKGGRTVDARFETELRAFIERFRLAGHDLEIDGPRFVPLEIVLTVCVAPNYFRSNVKRAMLDVFSNRDLPDGRRGFFHPDNFTFGEPVYLSEVIATAMDVPGVQWVDVLEKADEPPPEGTRFQRWGEYAHGEIDAGLIKMDRLEIVRLDNDPSLPENGRIDFLMEGGL